MRKMINKKGFSLVELMIVVVIMGILVAVAIPLYNAVTGNAEAKTCGSNQRLIRGAFANWALIDAANTAETLFLTTEKSFDGSTQNPEDVFAQTFLDQFDEGFPGCSLDDHYFVIERVDNLTIKVKCCEADGSDAVKHNQKGRQGS